MASDDASCFQCARDSVRFERLENPEQPDNALSVLYQGDALLTQVGQKRESSVNNTNPSKDSNDQKCICVVDSKKVLKKKKTPPSPSLSRQLSDELMKSQSRSLTPSPLLSGEDELEIPIIRIVTQRPLILPSGEKENTNLDEINEDYYKGDTMCAWCDDGGELVMCDGPCMRAFHMDRSCNPLKIPEDLKAAILNSRYPFQCPNCWSRSHRCFKCLKDFKFDVTSDDPQIVKCDAADCGRFYCVSCREQILKEVEINFHIERAGNVFICPLHYCGHCGCQEATDTDVLFPCRRCPIALHFNCMPKKISDNPTRVWQAAKDKDGNLLSCSQVSEDFFYCERHETRNMLQGPVQELNLFKDSLWKKWRTSLAMKFRCLESSASFLPARPRTLTEDLSVALAALNVDKDVPETTKSSWRVVIKKRTRSDRYASDGDVIAPMNDVLRKREEKIQAVRENIRRLIIDSVKHTSIDATEKELMVVYPYNQRQHVRLTEDRLDLFIHSVERANGDPTMLAELVPARMASQMQAALRSARVSCAPFLQPRYTSYGRHFTKKPILRTIVNFVFQYMKPNDLIVDFSCGANDFLGMISDACKASHLKIRLKGFDLFTPFRMDGFVRKNWFSVNKEDLDDGKNMIIGLNPPFGVNAALADRFIKHAAKFRPRLMMLICPSNTIVPNGYKVIHEDLNLCKDKAFYLPGSKFDQGNDSTPPFRILKRQQQ